MPSTNAGAGGGANDQAYQAAEQRLRGTVATLLRGLDEGAARHAKTTAQLLVDRLGEEVEAGTLSWAELTAAFAAAALTLQILHGRTPERT